jgi:hypothetical protein
LDFRYFVLPFSTSGMVLGLVDLALEGNLSSLPQPSRELAPMQKRPEQEIYAYNS